MDIGRGKLRGRVAWCDDVVIIMFIVILYIVDKPVLNNVSTTNSILPHSTLAGTAPVSTTAVLLNNKTMPGAGQHSSHTFNTIGQSIHVLHTLI